MFYKLDVTMIFTDYDPLNDILQELERHYHQCKIINLGTATEEPSHIMVQECYHDEDSNLPCPILREDFPP